MEESNNSSFEKESKQREDNISRCIICKYPIIPGAKKCIKCDSYQNILISILSGMDIKSLVALVPIVTLAFVFIKDQFTVYEAEINIAPLACNQDTVKVAVVNGGNKDAIFAGLDLEKNDGKNNINMQFSNEPKSELLIESGKVKIYEFTAVDKSGNGLGLNLSSNNPCIYHIKARSVGFSEMPIIINKVCACPKI